MSAGEQLGYTIDNIRYKKQYKKSIPVRGGIQINLKVNNAGFVYNYYDNNDNGK